MHRAIRRSGAQFQNCLPTRSAMNERESTHSASPSRCSSGCVAIYAESSDLAENEAIQELWSTSYGISFTLKSNW